MPSYSGWPLDGLPLYASYVLPRFSFVSGWVWSDVEVKKGVLLV